jgi:hypothetical protein
VSDPTDNLRFDVRSIYGANTRKGIVEVTIGAQDFQVYPSKAREMATMLLEAASAAEGDEILLRVLDRAGLSPQRAAQVLTAMRTERNIVERAARLEARRQIAEDEDSDDQID